jgi:hypothetical protein
VKIAAAAAVLAVSVAPLLAQEKKPVPKDSVRVSIPGCTKGYVFTAGRRTSDQPGTMNVPEGMHIRMNGPKEMIKDIKAHEGSMIEITGLMRKGQLDPEGVSIGKGVRISPGAAPNGGGQMGVPIASQVQIDLEGWRTAIGDCPSR